MNREDLAYLSRRIRLKFGLRFTPREDLICSRLAQSYLIAGRFKRIYHYHNHKTGGTSINQMFLGTSGVSGKRIHEKLRRSRNFRVLEKQKIFVGWNRRLIEQGNYFYAYSHIPAHQIRLPAHTFTITCIRDPVRRLLSYYNMLLDYREADYYRPNMEKQLKWLGSGFTDFIDNVPRSYRQRQLYMFSETYELQEALDRILNCSYLLFTDSLAEDVADLGQILGSDLHIGHARKSSRDGSLSPDEKRLAETVLEPELRLFEELRRLRSVQE